MKNRIKAFICLTLVLALSVPLLSSCQFRYDGGHDELYTVAINNIFGIYGHTSNGEISYDPEISVIETDDYGRTLFFYSESYGTEPDCSMAFVIMQASDSKYVYYYQDTCYLPFFATDGEFWHGRANGDTYLQAMELSQELIEVLKEQNDWNRELDESKFTKSKISIKKPEDKSSISEGNLGLKIYQHARNNGYSGSDSYPSCNIEYCNTDQTGGELYYVSCLFGDVDENGENIWETREYAVIMCGGEIRLTEITDITDYYHAVMKLRYPRKYL